MEQLVSSSSLKGKVAGSSPVVGTQGVCVKSLSRVHDRSRLKSCHIPPYSLRDDSNSSSEQSEPKYKAHGKAEDVLGS